MAATIEALKEIVERGSHEAPHLTGRLEKAAFIVLLRPIENLGEGTYRVASEDALKTYIVQNGQCECPDYIRHGNGHFCKHRLAVGMVARLNGGQAKSKGNGDGQAQIRQQRHQGAARAAPRGKARSKHVWYCLKGRAGVPKSKRSCCCHKVCEACLTMPEHRFTHQNALHVSYLVDRRENPASADKLHAIAAALPQRECCGYPMGAMPDSLDPAHWRYQCAVDPKHQEDVRIAIGCSPH